eukprot:CAMPEP_0185731826 /NCGR_PEP_ID=MMETSP1171-20130828/14025_1 /TAXON_ID=374046 /ORGANISM="Helicotheca tamensis, Strain CCMP826" /LENGTH=335 /DNA_ID=CAMNT_0028401169 /DNA_START=107 /DNA_END=1111 /DNA_ORIENTATION=-
MALLICPQSSALITTFPPNVNIPPTTTTKEQTSAPTKTIDTKTRKSPSLVIRSTKEHELGDITSLLAAASTDTSTAKKGGIGLSFGNAIQQLRTKAALETQLQHRFKAMEAGRNAASAVRATLVEEGMLHPSQKHDTSYDHVIFDNDMARRLLWSNDSFRSKLQRAVCTCVEKHGWGADYNFHVMPNDSKLLQHAMITAEDASTGSVIGFCEVAMLPVLTTSSFPTSSFDNNGMDESGNGEEEEKEHEELSKSCVPMIANLVTCPNHRRRGIATNLIRAVDRYVRMRWVSGGELGLYVDASNEGALDLYVKEGFIPQGVQCADENRRYYMSRSFR